MDNLLADVKKVLEEADPEVTVLETLPPEPQCEDEPGTPVPPASL